MPPENEIINLSENAGAMPAIPSPPASGAGADPDHPPSVRSETHSQDTIQPIESGASIDPPVKRGPGRPRKVATNAASQAPPRAASVILVTQPLPVDYEKTANIAANLWFNLGELVLGAEWCPDADERLPVRDGFRDYFESEKIGHIPASWGLGVILLAYTAKRVNKPSIRDRIGQGITWIKNRVSRR